MSEQRERIARSGAGEDSGRTSGQVVKANRRDIILTKLDTKNVVEKLNGLFDAVVSGGDYDDGQVRSAASLTNSMVKVLRFEFDVYKHFSGRPSSAQRHREESRDGSEEVCSISQVVRFLRSTGDDVKKGKGVGVWVINGRHCTEDDLLKRANNLRAAEGLAAFLLEGPDNGPENTLPYPAKLAGF